MTGVHASHKWYLIGPLSCQMNAKMLMEVDQDFCLCPTDLCGLLIYILIGECFDLGVCFALAICIGGFLVSPTQL